MVVVTSAEAGVWQQLTFWLSVALLSGVVAMVLKATRFYRGLRKVYQAMSVIPSRPKHWLMGHLIVYPGQNEAGLAYQRDLMLEFPKMSALWFGFLTPTLSLYHPDTLRKLLQSSEPKGPFYNLMRGWLGDGLIVSSGAKWLRNRRLLTRAFHFDVLKPYTSITNGCADVFLGKLRDVASQRDYFDVMQDVSMYTLDVILKCAFSYDTNCQTLGKHHPYVTAVNEITSMAIDRFFSPWLYNDYVYLLTPTGRKFRKNCNFVHQEGRRVIDERQKTLDSGFGEEIKGKKCLDFLDMVLRAKDENGVGLTDTEIQNEVDTFLFAGHDTTSSAISWTLWSLAEHPEHQKRVQKEVDDILDDRESNDITWDDMHNLPYLTMCIKEGLRLHSPVGIIQRKLINDLEIDGYKLPIGTTLNIHSYMLHHNPHLWENPMEYLPERFSPENSEKRDPFAFIPFSAGSRNCIGQNLAMHELKVLIARILREFDLKPEPGHIPRRRQELVMRSENGIHVIPSLRKRK